MYPWQAILTLNIHNLAITGRSNFLLKTASQGESYDTGTKNQK